MALDKGLATDLADKLVVTAGLPFGREVRPLLVCVCKRASERARESKRERERERDREREKQQATSLSDNSIGWISSN